MKSEDRYLKLFETIKDGIAAIDKEGIIIECNPAYAEMIDFTPQELVGHHYTEFTPPEFAIINEQIATGVKEQGEFRGFRTQKITKNGNIIWIEGDVFARYNSQNEIIGRWAIVRNVTNMVQSENDVKNYSENLEELIQLRTQNLAAIQRELVDKERLVTIGKITSIVAHDLRNPLQNIRNCLSLLDSAITRAKTADIKKNPEKFLHYYDRVEHISSLIMKSYVYANGVIDDVQHLSREPIPHAEPFLLRDFIDENLDLISLPEKLIIDFNEIPPNFELYADKKMVTRVFVNLIKNAIDAMPTGGTIRITASKTKDALYVRVADTGHGISVEKMPTIFNLFNSTKTSGWGIGLYLCKRIIEAHNGHISVKSELSKGTEFEIFLPNVQTHQ